MNYQIPFLRIIAAAVFFAWSFRGEFLKAISIPTLILVAVWGAWVTFSEELPWGFSWIIAVLYGLSFSFLAVTCHRLVLVSSADIFKPFQAKSGYRELRFLGWLIAIYVIKALVVFIIWKIAQDAGGHVFGAGNDGLTYWVKQLLSIPGLYVLARLSLALPATALDQRVGLRWSWVWTRGNGWRIFVVVGLFPWLMDMVLDLVSREGATVVEQVALFILAYVGIAIEVVALSLTYRELAAHYATTTQPASGEIPPPPTDATLNAFHELPQDARSRKPSAWVTVVAGLLVAYLLLGGLLAYTSDCSSQELSNAASPDGAYKAELVKRTCQKGSQEQGLVLDINRTASPREMYSYPLSQTVPQDVELVWATDRSLTVKYAGALDTAASLMMLDDIQLVFEKKLEQSKGSALP